MKWFLWLEMKAGYILLNFLTWLSVLNDRRGYSDGLVKNRQILGNIHHWRDRVSSFILGKEMEIYLRTKEMWTGYPVSTKGISTDVEIPFVQSNYYKQSKPSNVILPITRSPSIKEYLKNRRKNAKQAKK